MLHNLGFKDGRHTEERQHIEYLIEHVCGQANHGEVVNYQDRFKVDWLPFRHHFRPQPDNN